jgi:hypothetical protein
MNLDDLERALFLKNERTSLSASLAAVQAATRLTVSGIARDPDDPAVVDPIDLRPDNGQDREIDNTAFETVRRALVLYFEQCRSRNLRALRDLGVLDL